MIVEGTGLEDPETIHLEVRDGRAARALRGTVPMTGDVESYSVPGWFTTLVREFEMAKHPATMRAPGEATLGAPPGYSVYVWARFHPELGYPLHYRRIVGGSNRRVEMRVTRFEPR
jgi:hypothetical protein